MINKLPYLFILFATLSSCKSNEPEVPVRQPIPTVVTTIASTDTVKTQPRNICFAKNGNLFFTHAYSGIAQVTPSGHITLYTGLAGFGYQNGSLAEAKFLWTFGIVFDRAGNLYIADSGNRVIRKITPGGQVSTFAGQPYDTDTTSNIFVDGIGSKARFYNPIDLAIDKDDNLFVAEYEGTSIAVIRKITPDAKVTTYAGTAGRISAAAYKDPATLISPNCLAVSPDGELYIGSVGVIYKVNTSGKLEVVAGMRNQPGSVNGSALMARFGYISSLAFDTFGNLYIGESGGGIIRKLSTSGQVSTVTGKGYDGYLDGPVESARFGSISGMAFDSNGNLFISDATNLRIRKIEFK